MLCAASAAEQGSSLPGDDLVPAPDVVMDRAFSLAAPPAEVWPWLVQLGKRRGGWYLPAWLERFFPRSRRGLRRIDPSLQRLAVGEVIPDWGGTFTLAVLDPPRALVHTSTRGHTDLSWAIVLHPEDGGTRVQFRLRLAPVRRPCLAGSVGGLFDALTITGLAAGLRERLRRPHG
ncbi:MAG TPA: SRPBCC family protein [Dermatophilaceae bacterium]|nr:SRPBCC family protein [Dermatophilaceae bacterium]